MKFSVLGPLKITQDGTPIQIGGLNQRATLGYLLLYANETVGVSQLVRALWGESEPRTARKMLHNAVAGLRRTLSLQADSPSAPQLLTNAPGYALRVGDGDVDLARFRIAAAHGHALVAAGSWQYASVTLREALALWRGNALADLVEEGIHWPELAAVQNSRLAVIEDWSDAEINNGIYHEVIDVLSSVVEIDPLRERSCHQLMLALYRSGRQADALGVYRRTRTILLERFGLDPGRELQQLEHAILNHDPVLDGVSADRYASR